MMGALSSKCARNLSEFHPDRKGAGALDRDFRLYAFLPT